MIVGWGSRIGLTAVPCIRIKNDHPSGTEVKLPWWTFRLVAFMLTSHCIAAIGSCLPATNNTFINRPFRYRKPP